MGREAIKVRKILLTFFIVALIIAGSYPAYADQPAGIERTTVNGMSILLQKNKSEIAEVALLLKSGSGIELAGKKGTAYIMNNIVYWILDGSKSISGSVEVSTEPDYTLITITTLARDIKPTLERIKFLLSEPIYSYDVVVDLKQAMTTNLQAMLAETKAYSDFTREYYGAEHPYNDWPNPATIAAIDGSNVYKWYRQTYQPGNAILSISGGIQQNITDLENIFASMKSETVDRHLIIQAVQLDQDKYLKQVDPNGRATSFCMGFSAPRIQDPEYPAFRVLTYYLNDYQHYFEELRVKEGLFYSAGVYYNYMDKPKSPNIAFITMTDPDTLPELESRTLDIVHQLMDSGIDQNDIDKIIKAIKTEDESRKASGKGLAIRNALSQYFQTQFIYDEVLIPKLERVKTADIQQVAKKFLQHYIEVTYVPKKVEQPF
jgi:Predicted Zn-dependent peptidases